MEVVVSPAILLALCSLAPSGRRRQPRKGPTVPDCVVVLQIGLFFAYLGILSRNIRYIEHKNSDKIISKRNGHVYRCEMA